METQVLKNAKKDIPLYLAEFNKYWSLTSAEYSDDDLAKCYATTLIAKNWKISLNSRGINHMNEILDEVHEDVNASFFHSYFGHYRSAHMHLRSVIELSLQLLYFYQHEVEYHHWRNAEF